MTGPYRTAAHDLEPASLPTIPKSVVHMLLDAAQQCPDLPALAFGSTRLNYREYACAVAGVAAAWRGTVHREDRIVLVLPNSLDLAIATYAGHALGAQVAALNPRYTERELRVMIRDADPALVLYDATIEDRIGPIAQEMRQTPFQSIPAGTHFATCAGDPLASFHLPTHGDLATLQYTSGTSGRPKGVNITHGHLAHNVAQREALLPTRSEQERVLCVTPLFHVSAVAMALHLACYARAELIIHPRFDAEQTLRAITERQITLFSAVPTVFHALLAHPLAWHTDFSHLQYCYSGAAPLPKPVLDRWLALTGRPILEGYGLSEAGPCLTYNPALGPQKPGSVGIPVPLSEIQIVDLQSGDHVMPRGQEGELRVRGPHVMAGYRNLPELSAQVLRNGWFYTGDIACQDADGYIYIRDRKHDAINIGGHTVHPREIEEVLLSHPSVSEAAAFAVAHPYYGQVVQAWVVLRPDTAADLDGLKRFCSKNLVHYKVPDAIGITQNLPINSTGKIQRHKLAPVLVHPL